MSKNVTIKDIAARAGVSVALVSFVMNNRIEPDGKQKYRVSKITRDRILEVARTLNYQPNAAARTLRRGRSLVLGTIMSDISNAFYCEIARKLEEIAFRNGYTMLFGSSDESPEKFDRIARSFIDRGVEGFIVVPCEGSDDTLRYILSTDIPFVIMDRIDKDVPVPKIVLDNVSALKSAVSSLVNDGCRKIEMISYTMRVSSISEREEGFIARMKELGYEEDRIIIHRLPFESIVSGTEVVIPSIVDRGVEGLVFATNSLAVAAIKKLFRMGVKVQEDIRLVGFDNSDVYGLFDPPIPHIRQPLESICSESFNMLKKLIDKEIPQESSHIVMGSMLVR